MGGELGLRGDPLVSFPVVKWGFNRNQAMKARNLIIVAGHSIVKDGDLKGAVFDDDKWYLLDYQQAADMPEAFSNHIKSGINIALEDPEALLVFSGGQTRPEAGPKSEALSYFQVADKYGWWSEEAHQEVRTCESVLNLFFLLSKVRHRTVLEEFALDSFQNLLFSICRFREITGAYPARISVVSFSFKRERFEGLHRAAIRFPPSAFMYHSSDPDSIKFLKQLPVLAEWESKASVKPFKDDPYGCNSGVLRRKRLERDVYIRTPAYSTTCPEISELLSYW